jgi:drug/metabolite transporter (DMT)-like permease
VLILALTAAVVYGTADFLGGVAARKASPFAVMAATETAGAVLMLAVALAGGLLAVSGAAGGLGSWESEGWAMAGGVIGAAGLIAFYSGFARAPMSVVAPVSALVSTVLPVGVALAGGERPTLTVVLGALACMTAIVLVSAEPGASSAGRLRGLWYGMAAGAAFGLFFVCFKNAGHTAVLWPVAISRVTGSLVALIALAATRTAPLWRRPVERRLLGIALLSGLADAAANVFYILATRAGQFGLAVVITSLYPGVTVLLARVLLREKMRKTQGLGLLLAAAGIILVTA